MSEENINTQGPGHQSILELMGDIKDRADEVLASADLADALAAGDPTGLLPHPKVQITAHLESCHGEGLEGDRNIIVTLAGKLCFPMFAVPAVVAEEIVNRINGYDDEPHEEDAEIDRVYGGD
jgi:hypothetical protein